MLPNLCNLSLGGAPPGRVCCPPHHVSVGERYNRHQDAIDDIDIDPRRKKGESWTEEAVCGICREQLSGTDPYDEKDDSVEALIEDTRLDVCNHIFHTACLRQAIAMRRRTCPVCRTPIKQSVFDSRSFADLNAQEGQRDPLNPEGNAEGIPEDFLFGVDDDAGGDDAEDDISTFVAWAFRSNRLAVVELGELVRDLKSVTDFDTRIHGLSHEVAKLVVNYMDELASYVQWVDTNVGAPWYLRNTEELTRNLAGANNDATSGIRMFCDDPANNNVPFVVEGHGQETLAMMRRAYRLVRELTPDAVNARWKMSVTNNVGDILQTDFSSLPI